MNEFRNASGADSPARQAAELLTAVRNRNPLVHQITNYVTVNDCANITLAAGGSPIMADDIGEAAEIAAVSSALVLNIGTLNERTVQSMLAAGKSANEKGVPVVLDPVGAGASALRNRAVEKLLKEVRFAAVRGNLSEIRFAAGLSSSTRGVDAGKSEAADGEQESADTVRRLARALGCVAAATGPVDAVSDGERTLLIRNGNPMLSTVTGTGCMCSALVGCFCGVSDDALLAVSAGIELMGVAGELAFERAGALGSGSFRVALIDAVSRMDAEAFAGRIRIEQV